MGSKNRNLFQSIQCAVVGLGEGLRRERNLTVEIVLGSAAVAGALAIQLPAAQVAAVVIVSGLVVAFELMNTALEVLSDAFRPHGDRVVQRVKDMAAAVLVASLAALVVGGLVFGPFLLALFT